jgi:RNA ligase (TIGR02306 family)
VVAFGGFRVVAATADWQGGRQAVYIPVDMLVDTSLPEFAFLGPQNPVRIMAKNLRGIFSEGLLVPARAGWAIGQDVTEELGLRRYYPPEEMLSVGESAPAPGCLASKYTDIEQIKNFMGCIPDGEEVVVTEKLDGESARWTLFEGQVHIGTHTRWIKYDPQSDWGKVLDSCGLRAALETLGEGTILYGEIYGDVHKLKYGLGKGEVSFAAFDIFKNGSYVDYDTFLTLARQAGLATVPVLYRGPFSMEVLEQFAEQDSSLGPKSHLREGVIVRPVRERFLDGLGRVVVKLISRRYRLGDVPDRSAASPRLKHPERPMPYSAPTKPEDNGIAGPG